MRRLICFALALSCSAPPAAERPTAAPTAEEAPAEAVPTGRLPSDVRPVHYELELRIDPRAPSFTGKVSIRIDLERPRDVIWLHGNGLEAERAAITTLGGEVLEAKYEEVDPTGVVKLSLPRAVGPGDARIEIAFRGNYEQRLDALYRVKSGDDWYAFTQMEPVWARKAFPCFDEPAFKTRWDLAIVAPEGQIAIANTKEIGREALDGKVRLRYATTEALPTYLIAFAVGPLDVVEAPDIAPTEVRKRPLPFRGVATKGRGPELAYALAHTPALLNALEAYFDTEYPYDKLDIIAVPDKQGAMENAGAVTFREWLLLIDEKNADIRQRRAFAYVMAHELAHQWFGNLVTMPWWDDIWLNEAFATWMGYRVVQGWRADHQADVDMLTRVYDAMDRDRLTSGRQIRQPVESDHDIHNAFDAITYQKGGAVLGMFERWLGAETFRDGLRKYMRRHAHGSATADDLLRALGEASKKDVATPFNTFLMQPGLPFVEAAARCDGNKGSVALAQSRFVPLGSDARPEAIWQIPICLRYGVGGEVKERCLLMTEAKASVDLEGCPGWVMPNAAAAGYYQWSLEPAGFEALVKHGLSKLTVREKMSLARAVHGAFELGRLDTAQALAVLLPLAGDPHPQVAEAPMVVLRKARSWLEGDPLKPKVEALGRTLYAEALKKVGWVAAKNEAPERSLLRQRVIGFLVGTAQDVMVRKQAIGFARKYLGLDGDRKIHPEVIDPNLVQIAMYALGEEADAATFEAVVAQLETVKDDAIRNNLLVAIGNARDEALARRAIDLALSPSLRVTEVMTPLFGQLGHPRTRDGAWSWLGEHLPDVLARLSARSASWLPHVATDFCEADKAGAIADLFEAHMAKTPGGPRELKKAVETVRLCAATKEAQLPGVRAYFEKN
jgi:cytosol alanyl aminopeptidase